MCHSVTHGSASLHRGLYSDAPCGAGSTNATLPLHFPWAFFCESKYEIKFSDYAILIYHPVTTELDQLREHIETVLDALDASNLNFVVIYPNNDTGSDTILEALRQYDRNPCFRVIPSMRFEHFLTLLRNALAIVGNSSAGIREAPVYGVPVVNIGTRQMNRFKYLAIVNVAEDKGAILHGMRNLPKSIPPSNHFGSGGTAKLFIAHLHDLKVWTTRRQKQFQDLKPATEFTAGQAWGPW